MQQKGSQRGNATSEDGRHTRSMSWEEGKRQKKVVQFTAEVDQQIFNLHLRHLSGRCFPRM